MFSLENYISIIRIKGDVRNRTSEALKTIVFQIDRSPRLFVQKSSEMVRLKAYDTDFAFL